MHPILFKIPFLPDWLADVKSYGVMIMIGFLSGIYLACRRAYRSQANPDIVLNIGFLALVFGILGARLMFVFHYWDTRFANQPNPFFAAFDIRAGGLEFWGGPLLVIPVCLIYLRYIAKVSARWYLDITAPALVWGLAITRMGCFLNGCCWGSVCLDPHDASRQAAAVPWAVRFPYGSPAMNQQYKFGQMTLPAELIYVLPSGESLPLPRDFIRAAVKDNGKTLRKLQADLKEKHEAAGKALANFKLSKIGIVEAQCRRFGISREQLAELADAYRSKPVHPSQLYALVNGFLIYLVLANLYYYRRRHGIVLGWFLILYSISRVFLELIRQDNPLDVGGVTISQAISIATFLGGIAWLWIMSRMPLMSPRAVPYVPPPDEAPQAKPASKAKSSRRSN